MAGASDLPSLTVAIATTGARLERIALPPAVTGIDYIVTVQDAQAGPLPDWHTRQDVAVCPETQRGLSANRNSGITQARGALLLFSDDDIRLSPQGLERLRGVFRDEVGLALVLGWRAGQLPTRGRRRGTYRLTRFNSGRAAAPSIMIATEKVRASGIYFDTGFGIGSPCPLGEDYIFVTDVLDAGLRGISVPVIAGAHPGPSSGENWTDPLLIKSRATVLRRVFGHAAFPMRLLYAWRHRARFASFGRALRFAVHGL